VVKKVFLISRLMLFSFLILFSCKRNPTTPEEPHRYWARIEVVYDRDPAKITCPQCMEKHEPRLVYALFDPDRKLKSQSDRYIEGYYSFGGVPMEKIAENKFRGYLEQVFVQVESWHGKHKVFIQDFKLYDGISDLSTLTPYGITVEKAYEIEIIGYHLHFKVSKQ